MILLLFSIFHDLSPMRFLKVLQIFRYLSIINDTECIVKVSLFDHASVNTFLGIYYFFWHFYSFVGRKTKTKSIFNVDEIFQKWFKLSIIMAYLSFPDVSLKRPTQSLVQSELVKILVRSPVGKPTSCLIGRR